MRLFLLTLCAALGCQPIQTAPIATPPMLFTAPQAVPIGPAIASPPLQNNTILQPPVGHRVRFRQIHCLCQ